MPVKLLKKCLNCLKTAKIYIKKLTHYIRGPLRVSEWRDDVVEDVFSLVGERGEPDVGRKQILLKGNPSKGVGGLPPADVPPFMTETPRPAQCCQPPPANSPPLMGRGAESI